MISKKIYEKTPNGGDYSEIFYLDDNGNYIDFSNAKKCIIRECKIDGSLVCETYGICNVGKHEEEELF